MSQELLAVAVAGVLGIVGTIVGSLTATWLGQSAERRRLVAEDERRWLADRQKHYSAYLTLAESMLRQIDNIAVFLSYDGVAAISEEDEELIGDDLVEYFGRWEDELQPALSDVQLIAGGEVADLADRVSGALMDITSVVETRGAFTAFYPSWFRAQDLLGVLRNSMRKELGVKGHVEVIVPRSSDWPWLPGRPSEEEFIRRQARIPGRPPLTPAESARIASDDD